MELKYFLRILLILSSAISTTVFAHADHDKARFVATNGVDQGHCNNPVRPCKSIAYAVSRAAKGDKVLVASGEYTLTDESELFYLKSQLVPVIGGFNRFDHFQVQSPDVNTTRIIGAPKEFHKELHNAGFKVIADGKSQEISATLKKQLVRNSALFEKQSEQACVNGSAGAFSCNNVDLVAHVPLPSGVSGSDIWGHVDLNTGIEYAIMVYSDGTRVYSLQDPSSPHLVGHVSSNNTSWRDIKVLQYFDENAGAYQAYAYVTAEANTGLEIINLNNLPHSVSLEAKSLTITSAHNVYMSNVDYSLNTPINGMAPKLQIVGSSRYGGAFFSLGLNNPTSPVSDYKPSSNSRSNYTHDATSVMLDDERATRDCVNAQSGKCDVFIDFNEEEIRIWDATNTTSTTKLGEVGYDDVAKSSQYIHSGWWHENKRHVYVHDEFDENRGGLNTTVRILDLADLTNPIVVDKWVSNNRSIDHNGFVKGNRYYMSNYERGLTILDISDPVKPKEVGFFDTFPSSNNASFNGAWGTYPYLPSGNILISDINSGLYVVKDNSRNNSVTVSMESTTKSVDRGDSVELLVNKPGVLSEAATVYFDLVNGSAKAETDVTVSNSSKVLTWAANDIEPKAIRLNTLDNNEEMKKNLFVRLHNASGNLQIGDDFMTNLVINGLESQGRIQFVSSSAQVSESTGQLVVSVQRVGGTRGQLSVDYQADYITASDQDVNVSNGTLTWSDGDSENKTITIEVVDDELEEGTESFVIRLSADDSEIVLNNTLTVTVEDNDMNSAPEVYAGNNIEVSTNATANLASARVTDAEGDDVTYLWEQVSGVAVTLSNTTQLVATVKASSETGNALIRLTATDAHGASSSADMTVTVVGSSSSGGSSPIWFLAVIGLFVFRKRFKK